MADVQRIIAGNPPPTPPPEPTATVEPGCAGAIWWHEAHAHVGETRVVQGPVVAVRPASNTSVMLEIGQVYPDPTGMTVIVPAGSATDLAGKSVCVGGRITSSGSASLPTIELRDAASIRVVN